MTSVNSQLRMGDAGSRQVRNNIAVCVQTEETQAKPRPGQTKPTKQKRSKLKLKKKMETNACKEENIKRNICPSENL
jgi:hypothetical protein